MQFAPEVQCGIPVMWTAIRGDADAASCAIGGRPVGARRHRGGARALRRPARSHAEERARAALADHPEERHTQAPDAAAGTIPRARRRRVPLGVARSVPDGALSRDLKYRDQQPDDGRVTGLSYNFHKPVMRRSYVRSHPQGESRKGREYQLKGGPHEVAKSGKLGARSHIGGPLA